MKDIKLQPFTLDALELSVPWYDFQCSEETVSTTLSDAQINNLIRDLKKRFKTTYEDRKASTASGKAKLQYASRIANEGTQADRAARAALLVKENIFAYTDELAVYIQIFTKSKSCLCSYSGGFVDLTLLLAPSNRQPKPLTQQIAFWQLQKQFPIEENAWLKAIAEDAVAQFIENGMTSLLTVSAQAKLPQLNITAIKVMGPLTEVYGLAQSGTAFLMQQISSSNNQIAQAAAKELRQLKSIVAQAHSIVLSLQQIQDCHQRLLKLDTQSLDARKRPDGTLRGKGAKNRVRKAQLRKEIQEASKLEANKRNTIQRQLHQTLAYLSSFGFLGGLDSSQLYSDLAGTLLRLLGYLLKFSDENNENINTSKQLSNGGSSDLNQKGQLKKQYAKENENDDYNWGNDQSQNFIKSSMSKVNASKHEIGHYGIVKQVLRVLGRIFERAKLAEAQGLRIALQQLLDISTVSSFGISVLILELVFKYVENSYKYGAGKLTMETINAFLHYLYKLTIRYDAMAVNRQSNILDFYRLIVRVFKSYAGGMCYNSELLSSITKRIIQTQSQALNPEALLNAVLTLQIGAQYNAQECKKGASKGKNFKSTFPFSSPFQALPTNTRTQIGGIRRIFDIESENPMTSQSSQDQFWENQLLQVHYHPSARHFAKTYSNNELADFIDIVQQYQQLIEQGKIKQSKHDQSKYVKQPFDPNNVFQIIQGDSRFLTDHSGTKVNQLHLQQVENIINESKREIEADGMLENMQDDEIDNIIVQDLIKRNVIQPTSRFVEVQQLQGNNVQPNNTYDNDPFYQKIMKDLQEGAKNFTAEEMAAMDGLNHEQFEYYEDDYESDFITEEQSEDEFEQDIQQSSVQNIQKQEQLQSKSKKQSLPRFMSPEEFEKYNQSQFQSKNETKQNMSQQDDDNPLLKAMRKRVMH